MFFMVMIYLLMYESAFCEFIFEFINEIIHMNSDSESLDFIIYGFR